MTAKADERCELTELLVGECGCRQHRGGQTPDEEVDAERAQIRTQLLSRLGDPRWFRAQYPGMCSVCGEPFQEGAAIRARGRFDKEPVNDSNWIADCCATEEA